VPADARQSRGSWWPAAAFAGLMGIGALAAFAWSDLHPADLAAAETSYRQGHLHGALELAEKHLARRPGSRAAALLAAQCLSRLGRPDDAEIYYARVAPLDMDARHIRAYALVLNNRREPAISAYREILVDRPDDVLALSRMAAVLISESRWAEALDAAARMIAIPESTVIGHTLAGVVHHNMGDSELAVFAFDRVVELDPKLVRIPLRPRTLFWTEFGHNLLVVGRWSAARRYLRQALDEGDDPKVADLLGQSYYLEGAYDDAEQFWRLAVSWDPKRHGTWWRIGKLELQRGRPAEAIEPLRRATELAPRAIGPKYSLALAYRRLGQSAEADQLMAAAGRLRGSGAAERTGSSRRSLLETDEAER
jgi:tetratricopeptide (TPR) repeat protein